MRKTNRKPFTKFLSRHASSTSNNASSQGSVLPKNQVSRVNGFKNTLRYQKKDQIFEKIKKYLDAPQQELKSKFELLSQNLVSERTLDDDADSIIKTYTNQATEVLTRKGARLRTYADKTVVMMDEEANITLVSALTALMRII